MSWNEVLFGSIVDLRQGMAFNKKNNHLIVEKGIPLLRIVDLNDGTETKFVNEELAPTQFIAKKDDIIYSRTGVHLGLVYTNREGIVHNNCFRVIPKDDLIDKKYLYWYLKQPKIIEEARSKAGGSAQPDLNHGAFKSIIFKYPSSLEEQKKIADILSAYDDLIENNLKRIKLLEEAAQNIYKEWFVNFRFPNHENTLIDNNTGLPEGWSKDKVDKYFEFERGVEVGSKNYLSEESDDTIPFLRVGSLSTRNTEIYTNKSLVKEKILSFSDICISMDGSIGVVGYGMKGAYSTGLRKVISIDGTFGKGFIFSLLNSENIQNTIRAFAKGSTILHASSSIKEMTFNKADKETITKANSILEPIYNQMLLLTKHCNKLKEARDILLPRLMNQTIEV